MPLIFGWKGTSVTSTLWPVYFSKQPLTSSESKIDALTKAIEVWPQSEFYQDRAFAYQEMLSSEPDLGMKDAAKLAIADYLEGARRHRFDPTFPLNRANLLSRLERDDEAEKAFALSLQLQGGMEPAFRGHFYLANHYLRKGLRQFKAANPSPALDSLERASDQIETAVSSMHWTIADMVDTRLSIHESLGTVREAAGDAKGALDSYKFAAKLPNGNRANYRAGVLVGDLAAEKWAERRTSEALGYFIQARSLIAAAKELPKGATPIQRVEYLTYLDQTIAFLKGAKIEPTTPR
jgi:tetratricopeptide (TPR) repeat protein